MATPILQQRLCSRSAPTYGLILPISPYVCEGPGVSIVIMVPAVPDPEQVFEQQLNESFALFRYEPLQSSTDVQISPPSCAQVFIAVDGVAELFTCAAAGVVTSVCVAAGARTVGCAGAVCSIRSPVHPATRTVPTTSIPRTIEKRVDLLIVTQSP